MMKTSILIGLLLCAYFCANCQTKNRITLSYHTAYIMERDDLAKLGVHLNFERKLGKNWSTALELSIDDYCRCELEPYQFRFRSLWFFVRNDDNSSPHLTEPALSRFQHWTWLTNYSFSVGGGNREIILGSGLTYRSGFEHFFLFINRFEAITYFRRSSDWAIPIRIAYRYDPPHRWWGLTAYILYKGYFRYKKDYGNNPMNVLQAGVNFDIRFGKREELKRE